MIYEAAIGKDVPISETTEAAPPCAAADPGRTGRHCRALPAPPVPVLYPSGFVTLPPPTTFSSKPGSMWCARFTATMRARSFDTWLFAIAHNVAMDLFRRPSR